MISKQTAMDIALAYREIEVANQLLADITAAMRNNGQVDVRDAFGRPAVGLQLGVPSGTGHRLYNVPWSLAKPVIEAHIAHHRAIISALNEKARHELAEWAERDAENAA